MNLTLIFSFLFLFGRIDLSTVEMIDKEYSHFIEKAVEKYPYINARGEKKRLNSALIKAIIYQESGGKPDAKSLAGAYGLTQIMPRTAKILNCDYDELNIPQTSIECASKFLAALLTYNKGDLIKTLSGYNGGTYSTENHSTTRRGELAGKIYDNEETKNYVVSVLRLFDFFKKYEKKKEGFFN